MVKDLVALKETTWFNPGTTSLAEGLPYVGLTEQDFQDAHARVSLFAPYLAKAFPETAATGGIIESELVAIPAMQKRLEKEYQQPISGQLLLKKMCIRDRGRTVLIRSGRFTIAWLTPAGVRSSS